jgi:hypothetical protein
VGKREAPGSGSSLDAYNALRWISESNRPVASSNGLATGKRPSSTLGGSDRVHVALVVPLFFWGYDRFAQVGVDRIKHFQQNSPVYHRRQNNVA